MEIYLSAGVTTLVALLAAHRILDGRNRMAPAGFDPEEFALLEDDGYIGSPPLPVRLDNGCT